MTATLVLSGTSSFGARPIVAKARIWAADPVGQRLGPGRLRVAEAGGSQDCHEDLGLPRLARQPVDDHRYRIAGVIHEQLVAAQMRLAHRDRQLDFRVQISFAVTRIAYRTGPI